MSTAVGLHTNECLRNPGENNSHKEDYYIRYIWDHQRNLCDDLVTTFTFTYVVPKQVSSQTFKYV